MEDLTEAKPFDIGSICFFDQMKLQKKKNGKREDAKTISPM